MCAAPPPPVNCANPLLAWLPSYMGLRTRRMSSQGARYLLYEAEISGFGDRIDGLLFSLCLAALSERVLLTSDDWFSGYLRPKLRNMRFNASIHPALPATPNAFFTTGGVLPRDVGVDADAPLVRVKGNAAPHHAHVIAPSMVTRTRSGSRVAQQVGMWLADRDRIGREEGSMHTLDLHLHSACLFSSLLEMAPALVSAVGSARQVCLSCEHTNGLPPASAVVTPLVLARTI